MPNPIRKHGFKVLIFITNIILTVVAVFVIREKDKTRLLENSRKQDISNDQQPVSEGPSSKETLNLESEDTAVQNPSSEDQQDTNENSNISPALPFINNTAPSINAPVVQPAPVPVPKATAVPDRKTKTS